MTSSNDTPFHIEAELSFSLSLDEISHSFGVSTETIITIIDEGIISPSGGDETEWQFDGESMSIIRTVLQLKSDLGVNVEGAGLALELMREIQRLNTLLRNANI